MVSRIAYALNMSILWKPLIKRPSLPLYSLMQSRVCGVYAAFSYWCMRPYATHVSGLTLLVYEAFSYLMQSRVCGVYAAFSD